MCCKLFFGLSISLLIINEKSILYNFNYRSWILLNGENQFIPIKHEPKLVLTKCSFHNDNELWIEAPDMPILKLKLIESLSNAKIIDFK
jgi:hypothetical protein